MDEVGDVVEFACTFCGLEGVTSVEQLRREGLSELSRIAGGGKLRCPKCGRPLKLYLEVRPPALVTV